jgi:hypothetical protein
MIPAPPGFRASYSAYSDEGFVEYHEHYFSVPVVAFDDQGYALVCSREGYLVRCQDYEDCGDGCDIFVTVHSQEIPWTQEHREVRLSRRARDRERHAQRLLAASTGTQDTDTGKDTQ